MTVEEVYYIILFPFYHNGASRFVVDENKLRLYRSPYIPNWYNASRNRKLPDLKAQLHWKVTGKAKSRERCCVSDHLMGI
jgi:hypothetical protein